MADQLTVDEIVSTRPAVREAKVRTHAPALVIVLEVDAPPRYYMIATPEEVSSLQGMVLHDTQARETWSAFNSVHASLGDAELVTRSERVGRWADQLEVS